MRHDQEPWKWPLACGLALLLLLAAVFLVPRSWLHFGRGPLAAQRSLRPAPPAPWLTLLPPPEIQSAPAPEIAPDARVRARTEELADPRWWSAAWRIRIDSDISASGPATADPDSLELLRRELDLTIDPLAIVPSDSLLARRLALLKLHDADRFEELKPYFHAAARARNYRDLMSRVNAMYDEFLHREIMVPD